MRVAFVITRGDDIGGAQVHVRDMCSRLLAKGYEVRVFMGGGGALADEFDRMGVSHRLVTSLVHPLHPVKDVAAVVELMRGLHEFDPDLVTAHSSKAGILARLAGFMLGTPTIFTAHGWAFTEGVPERRRQLYRWLEGLMAPLASRLICVSHYDQQLALKHRVGSPEQLVTIHNGMPEIGLDLLAQPEHQPPRAIMVARLAPPKDHETVLRAMAAVPVLALDILGDGPNMDRLQALAHELGIQDRVTFWGHQAHIAERLAKAQLFVLASDYEAFPLSILEAMRAGLPVIATNVGGVSEAVVDGETGYLVPKRDHSILVERLTQLAADPVLRMKLGKAGRARFMQHFMLDVMIEQTVGVYERVVPQARQAAAVARTDS